MAPSRERIAELLRDRDPLAAARAAGVRRDAPLRIERGDPDDGRLIDGELEGAIAAHRAAHRAGRRSEATVRYGAAHDADAVAARLVALAELAESTGMLAAVHPIPDEGTDERPGSWGVEDLTVIAACRMALPDAVAVLPDWRRLGEGACQIAAAFGADGWRVPARAAVDPERLAGPLGRGVEAR